MKEKITFLKQAYAFFKPFRKKLFVVLLFTLGISTLGQLTPWIFSNIVDAVTQKNTEAIVKLLGISLILYVLRFYFLWKYKELYEQKYLDYDIQKHIAVISMKKMFSFSIGQHVNEHSGVKQTIINKGKNSLIQFVNDVLFGLSFQMIEIFTALVFLTVLDWRISLMTFVFLALYFFTAQRMNKRYFPQVQGVRKKRQDQGKFESELIRNTTLIIAEAKEDSTLQDFEKRHDVVDYFVKDMWIKFISHFYKNKLIIVIGQFSSLTFGVYLIMDGYHTTGTFVALYSWIGSLFGNIQTIMNRQRAILLQVVEIKKYFDLLEITPAININTNGKVIKNFQGKIEFKNVSFSYPERTDSDDGDMELKNQEKDSAIKNVSFVIHPNTKTGFVGVSGSGKTTILNLIRRYYDPSEGEILIDDIPLCELDLQWFRKNIGNVEQKIDLFDRSIKENILFGVDTETQISDTHIEDVVVKSSLTEFVSKLTEYGLNTHIGESGIKVSGGERQRIGIARALIKNPRILVFDEATSALDTHNESIIHDAINSNRTARTVVVVAHRLSTVIDSDNIIVVDNGTVVASGTHLVLQQTCHQYQKIVRKQMPEEKKIKDEFQSIH